MKFDGLNEYQTNLIVDLIKLQLSDNYRIRFLYYYRNKTSYFIEACPKNQRRRPFSKNDDYTFQVNKSDIKFLIKNSYIDEFIDPGFAPGDGSSEKYPCLFYLQPLAYAQYASQSQNSTNKIPVLPPSFLNKIDLLNELRNLILEGYDLISMAPNYGEGKSENISWRIRSINLIEKTDSPKVKTIHDIAIDLISSEDLHELLKATFDLIDGFNYEKIVNKTPSHKNMKKTKKVFVVHGHDEVILNKVARFLEKLDLETIILFEQANRGKTIIEKLEHYSDVFFAVVLLTPDDLGKTTNSEGSLKPRARQNVVFELGYFIGLLGRSNVVILYDETVELPSDYHGVVYTKIDKAGAWKIDLAKEMKDAGLPIDVNNAI